MNKIVPVTFHDHTIDCIQEPDGKVYVSIRRMCENLGVSFQGQHAKLKKQPWATIKEMLTVGADGKPREMDMLPLDHVPIWLATIQTGKVAVSIRPALIRYQCECRDVLARHFGVGTPDATIVARLEKIEGIVVRPGEADLQVQLDRVVDLVLKVQETMERRITAPALPPPLTGKSGTLREFPVERKAMQLLIARTARGLGWRFGAVQARLASTLGVKSYLYMEIGRLDEARRVLADMMYRTTQQAAEKSEAEQVRDQQRKVYEVAMSEDTKKSLN